MEVSEEEDTPALICRRVSLRKRSYSRVLTDSRAPWINNSFVNNNARPKTSEREHTYVYDEDEVHNQSDLLLAEMDLENFATVNSNPSSPEQKRPCSNVKPKDQHQKRAAPLKSVSDYLEHRLDHETKSPFHGEEDLFGDDDFDEIFFSKKSLLPSPCGLQRKNNVENVQYNLNDNNSDRYCSNKKGNICHSKENSRDYEVLEERDNHTVRTKQSFPVQSLSLKDRIKQRLLDNTGEYTPMRENVESKLREEALIKARLDASQIRKEGTNVDIGPFYGLPSKVQELFESLRGISKLYDWQDECLRLPAIKDRKNLIYTLPTSGGKTLVAEVLMLRELLCHKKDALLILPFVSIVQEKVRGISEFATDLEFLVEEYAGSKGRFPPVKRRQKKSLYIATIEKGHSLVNSLIENNRLDSLGLVVVDELHMLGEGGSRGAALESTLLKLLHSEAACQIIGMSATLNNISDIQAFLQADVYANDFRPVSLQEYVKIEDNLFSVNPNALSLDDRLEHSRVTIFPHHPDIVKRDPDQLLGLVKEVIPDNSCLVFCSTKKNCESVALMLSELMCKHQREMAQVHKQKRRELLQELHRCGNAKICPTLSYTVHFGLAYHHSGLTMDERRLIEEAYAQGTLCLLTCTSTLAAGVNLPAKRVILRSPYVGREFIKYSQYKQMTGRAGRAGLDATGESILIAKKQDRLLVKELLSGPKDVCHSSLMHDGGKGIQSLLLSAIGLKIVTTMDSALNFLQHSLLSIQGETLGVMVTSVGREALRYLVDHQLVVQGSKVNEDGQELVCLDVTLLGKATFKGSVNHVYSPVLYTDLHAGEQSLVVSNHFHLLYLVTPYDIANALVPAWDIYYKRYCQLSETELRVADMVGVSEQYLGRKSIGLSSRKKVDEMVISRFYLALMLWDLWNQQSIWDVADRFAQTRGFVQNLLSGAASFAACVFHFCQELEEFWPYQDLLGNLVKRLSYCVTAELIPLMEVPGVLLARAKQLYSAGITSLAALAAADADDLVRKIEHLSKRNARQIISAAKNLVEEKTAVLMEEVETLITVTGGARADS